MVQKGFDSVEQWFRWKLNIDSPDNIECFTGISVEEFHREKTDILKWEITDVLYSFTLIYYLGLCSTQKKEFERFFEYEKQLSGNKYLKPFSNKFLYKCSIHEKFEKFNNREEIKNFISVYFSLGNVIPIWPGGNEARGKMGVYDIPELFFNKYPKWTEELKRQYTNSRLDIVVNNELFFVSHEKENGWNIKGDKGTFSNLKEFITLIEKDENFYFDYLRRRNKIIKLREQLLLEELSQL